MTTQFHSEHHARLNMLAGLWDTVITMLGPDGSEGESSQATDNYTWMPNGHFLVHEVDATMAGKPVQSMEIFGVDSATGAFFSRSYDADGSVNDFTARIVQRQFSIDGQSQRFAGTFSQDGRTMRGEWKQLAEGQWLPFVRIVLTKRA